MAKSSDQMYCSEQICIPPTFPYILRQFAKAAIRTQPNDLCLWSATYFRCLSLNIPPPVKTRLEYPITDDYKGLTPGWLKTLYKQFGNTQMVTFRTLYDRWNGACLKYDDLITILCLGKFDNNQQIPIIKFLSLCAGLLTENLTKTMILICEIFTDEPDGGSAMISKQIFLDCYQFLACQIDAADKQVVRNYQFLEKFLNEPEYKEESVKEDEPKSKCKSSSESEISIGVGATTSPTAQQITAIDYLHLVTESQSSIRIPDEEEMETTTTDTTICSIDEELPNDIQEYLEKIQHVDEDEYSDDEKQQKQQQKLIIKEQEIIDEQLIKEQEKSDELLKEIIIQTPEFEDIEIHPVPGIGPVVPQQLYDAVYKYFNAISEFQHDMVMPRNIRHYECPPLEIFDFY